MTITLYHLVPINLLRVSLNLLVAKVLWIVCDANIDIGLVLHVEIVPTHFHLLQILRVATWSPHIPLSPLAILGIAIKLLPQLLPVLEMKH